VNIETKEQLKQLMHTHSSKMSEKLSACQKTNDNYFLRQERSADGGIHAMGDHNNVRSVLQNTQKNCVRPLRKKRHRLLASSVVLLHDNARPHTCTAGSTPALPEHFNWELFGHSSYSLDLTPSGYCVTYLGMTALQ
jgi:hypothetical protein